MSDNARFLGYKVNISFLAEKIPYSQICDTKVGPSYKNGVHASVAATHLWYNEENTKLYLADLDNMHKVVLGAKSEEQLKKLGEKLDKNNINHKVM